MCECRGDLLNIGSLKNFRITLKLYDLEISRIDVDNKRILDDEIEVERRRRRKGGRRKRITK